MFDDWKSKMIPQETHTPKKSTPRWRTLLIGASFLLGSNLAAFPGAALILPPPPTDYWRIYNNSRECPSPRGVPGIWEVFLFTEKDGGGSCRSFTPGLYPDSGWLVIPDNSVKSIYVGRYVRVALFKDPVFAGLPRLTSSYANGIANLDSPWDKQVSSMRVEIAARSSWPCNDLRSGEFALYTGEDSGLRGNDYFILPTHDHHGWPNGFPSSAHMGVWDNHIVAIDLTKSDCDLFGFDEPGYGGTNGTPIYTHGYEWETYPQKISSIRVARCY
jgi:hypothetical protein